MVHLYVKKGRGIDPINRLKGFLHFNESLINRFINVLPFELHLIDQGDDGRIRKSSFDGPGTKLKNRLEDFDSKTGTYTRIITPPINRLDQGAMIHDIEYAKFKDVPHRNIADRELSRVAGQVIKNHQSTDLQKFNAQLVKKIMDYKIKNGRGFMHKFFMSKIIF